MNSRLQPVHLAIGAVVLVLAATLIVGAMLLPVDKGYTIVGTRVFPLVVAFLVGIVGLGLVWQSMTGGFRLLETEAIPTDDLPLNQRVQAALWVSGGLLVDALLIDRIGFVLASTALFAAAARGFGSTRWVKNVAIGLALSWPIYLGFTKGLGLSLPGLFKPWI
jgi:putative tricarboxylic transport membrane protein